MTSSSLQEDHRPFGPISSGKLGKKYMMLSESLQQGGPTGLLLQAIGKMEVLLVPARVTRLPTGREVIQVIQHTNSQTQEKEPEFDHSEQKN
ncbi:hypothetical protein KIN20_017784 [Parelaphostrongylus tenuis]|uniref:Uncharacterized protein n=1 Tax=Parelaphostrongylus tenuis TaxID=148309 RepID=A0AAD5MNQ5_PARTN|nr:hypothetical protein KIN20_017784 [Parelaphostrongylus tenuis]